MTMSTEESLTNDTKLDWLGYRDSCSPQTKQLYFRSWTNPARFVLKNKDSKTSLTVATLFSLSSFCFND